MPVSPAITQENTSGLVANMLVILLLAGCVHQESVTTRPEYAYPQHLVSLCHEPGTLSVSNLGIYASSEWGKSSGDLLLSSQLLPAEPAVHRDIERVRLVFAADATLLVTAYDARGDTLEHRIPAADIECGVDGELLVHFPSFSYYFWASVGTRDRELALWTNRDGGLVLHNRSKETHAGLVGGTVTTDAWALFDALSSPTPVGLESETRDGVPVESFTGNSCPQLTDDYEPVGQVVHADGSLDTRTATEQFFREEIIGIDPVNQQRRVGTRLAVHQDQHGIELRLYDAEELLATRLLEESMIRCEAGRWRIQGETQFESAWLLIIASGGAHWENLSLWRDDAGDLMVEGVFKRRVALFLVPMIDTQTLFMVFPLKPPIPDP